MLNSLGLPKRPADTKVIVAMSGGVDSSVVAGLLSREGYDVVGITLQLYDHGAATHRKGACCAGQDIHDARRVAERLGIAHYVLDYEERFRHAVIDTFVDTYVAGKTPVPCASCNQTVKFADLLETARELGSDLLATGHYVATRDVGGRRALFTPADVERDQSYFLFGTTQAQLDVLRFPLGGMEKAEVRRIARELGLIVADKADSQDICFVPTGRYAEMIERLRPDAVEPGEIVHLDGRVLGRHDGVLHYTVGQRRGIGVALGEPLYVIHIDAALRRVVVGPREALATRRLTLTGLNWLGDGPVSALPPDGVDLFARVRSTRPPQPARLVASREAVFVDLAGSETGVAPGQACVLYDAVGPGARVLGGGWIDAASHGREADAALQRLAARPAEAVLA